MFAEIADKMLTLGTMWGHWVLIGLLIAIVTAGLSMIRLWIGGVVIVLSIVPGLLASTPDGIMDRAIIRELGAGYLFHQRISGFVPFVLALAVWIIVWLSRRPFPGRQRTTALLSDS
jgi:hypothetical protein